MHAAFRDMRGTLERRMQTNCKTLVVFCVGAQSVSCVMTMLFGSSRTRKENITFTTNLVIALTTLV